MRVRSAAYTIFLAVSLASAFSRVASSQAPPANSFDALLHQGFELHQRQQYSEALPLLRRAWKLQPRDYFANLLVGIDLLRTGQRAEAVGYLKIAAKLRPQEEFPHEYLGEAYAGLKQFADASTAFSRASAVAPQSSQAAVALVDFSLARFAQISSELRSTKKGLAAEYRLEALSHPVTDASRQKLLRRSVELDDKNSDAWSDLALTDLATGDRSSAEENLGHALSLNRENLSAQFVEALLAAQSQNWKAAGENLNNIARHSGASLARSVANWPQHLLPSDAAVLTGVAAKFVECVQASCRPEELLGRLPPQQIAVNASAAENFQDQRWEQVAAAPAPPPARKDLWFQRGSALAHMGNCGSATSALERSLEESAPNVEALFLLAVCYAQSAGAGAERFQQAGGQQAALHTMRGDVLLRLQANGAAAADEYQAALKLDPGDPRILDHLAEAQFANGQNDAARASAEAALQRDPNRGSAQRTLTKIAMQDRDYARALPLLRQLAGRDPNDLAVRIDLATACAQTGALEEALRYLTPALKAGYPDEKGRLHYLLGTVLRDLGRASEANEAFAAARRLSDSYQQSSRGDHDAQP